MDFEPIFVGNDLKLIESLVYNPDLEPGYEHIKACLGWSDEVIDGLTPEGYQNLCDLLIARSFIHRSLPFSSYRLDPLYFADFWERALKQGFSWPGFKRLVLSEKDQAFYDKMRVETADILS